MESWHFLALLVIGLSAIWAYFDASRARDAFQVGVGPRNLPPHTWASLVFLAWPVALPIYVRARAEASFAEPRQGPPPRFIVRGFTLYAVAGALAGLGLFFGLVISGRFELASLGLVLAAVSLFGGRRAELGTDAEEFSLGDAGLEQVGFTGGGVGEEKDEDGEVANADAYFANLSRPQRPPSPGVAAPATPGVTDPAGPAPGQPVAAGPPTAPPPTASLESPPAPPGMAPPAPPPPGGPQPGEPPSGVPYEPPPPGVFYAPTLPGTEPSASPAQPPATASGPQADPKATVALTSGSVASELRSSDPAHPAPAQPAPPVPAGSVPQATAPELGSGAPPGTASPPPFRGPAQPAPPTPSRPAPPGAAPIPGLASPSEGALLEHEPLVPPPPAASRPGKPRPRPAAGRPAAAGSGGYGYAASASSSRGRPWGRIAAGAVVAALAGGASWYFLAGPGSGPTTDFAIEPMPARQDEAVDDEELEAVDDSSSLEGEGEGLQLTPEEQEEVEAEEAIREAMSEWLETYGDLMGQVGATIEEIDFEGLETGRCNTLRKQLNTARKNLSFAADDEIEVLVKDGLGSFLDAYRACKAEDESAWAISILDGKQATHEAQELMEQRYSYRGVLELELESAVGGERSPDSITGRFLAEQPSE